MTLDTKALEAAAREHLKLKFMTPSKITGEPYQMVPAEFLEAVIVALSATPSRNDILEEAARVADAERDRHWQNYVNGKEPLDAYYTTAAENVAAAIRALVKP